MTSVSFYEVDVKKNDIHPGLSNARSERRMMIVNAAKTLIGVNTGANFNPVHALLCALDVVMIAGVP